MCVKPAPCIAQKQKEQPTALRHSTAADSHVSADVPMPWPIAQAAAMILGTAVSLHMVQANSLHMVQAN
jgi:hypothetical protein